MSNYTWHERERLVQLSGDIYEARYILGNSGLADVLDRQVRAIHRKAARRAGR